MLRGNQAVSLPSIQENYIQIGKIFDSPPKSQTGSKLRSKTQSFTNKHKRTFISASMLLQNVSQMQQIKIIEMNQDSKIDKIHKISKEESVSKIIDTRKSIRMLLEYFDSKSQQQRNKNLNCYHSPKKQIYNLIPFVNTPQRNIIRRKVINLKKIKIQQKKLQIRTQGNQSPVKSKKYDSFHMKDVIRIQQIPIDNFPKQSINNFSANKKLEDDQKEKLNSFSDSKQRHSVIKIKSKDQILGVQRKPTEFEGWHIQNDNNYLQ